MAFSVVLNMSITASAVILCVLLARLLLRRAPKIFSYALWAVVLFRLLCPVSVSSSVSLMGVFRVPAETRQLESPSSPDRFEQPVIEASPAETAGETEPPMVSNAVVSGGAEPAAAESGAGSEGLWTAAGWIWAGGMAVLLGCNLMQLLRLRRRLVGAAPLGDNVYLADHLEPPFVLGLLRPRIYLPSDLSEAERSYIIAHERHHIRRGDPWIRLIAFAALCLHWFNPLVWVAFALSGRDMEMSCDEAVLRRTGRDIRAAYASSLLRLSAGRPWSRGTPLAFGEGDPKRRIRNIMAYRKPALWVVVIAASLCVILTACLGVNPSEAVEDGTPSGNTADTTADDASDSAPPESEADDPPADDSTKVEPDLRPFREILSGEAEFVDAWTGEPVDLSELGRFVSTEPISAEAEAYTAVDLDQDGATEVVLQLENAPTYGYVILHLRNGTVYGYSMPYRGILDLKADGTFTSSGGAGNTVIGTLVFGETTHETVELARSEVTYDAEGPAVVSYFVNGKPSTQRDFEQTMERQNQKPAAVWYAMEDAQAGTNTQNELVATGYITVLDSDTRRLEFDVVSYLNAGVDDDALRALGVDPDTLPNGYYIYNPEETATAYDIAADVQCWILDSNMELTPTDLSTFVKDWNTRTSLYTITVATGVVTELSEHYLP